MVDFASLKKSSKSNFDKLTAEVSKLSAPQGGQTEDTRFWQPEVDKAGNGYAVIRFLPSPAEEDIPFVRVWDHGFQGPGGWYIEKSLTTLGQKDPVSEYNSQLWATGSKANQDQVRKQKRRLTYISNIYVVKDPAHPENEGKVFLFKYGKKIWDKINLAMHPEFEDEKATNPFDLWDGANFKLKIRKVEGYRNYDKSEFEASAPLADDDEMEAIWKKEYALQPFLDPSEFKAYDTLKARLYKVLGLDGGSARPATTAASYDEEEAPKQAFAAPARSAAPTAPRAEPATWDEDSSDPDMDFFKKLAEEE
jgi:hypothetical protein